MSDSLIGIQTYGSLFAHGNCGETLDRFSAEGGVNAVFLATQSFFGEETMRGIDLGGGYTATPHSRYYANTKLGSSRQTVAGEDALETLLPKAAARGLKVYSWLSETPNPATAKSVPGWVDILQVDVFGRRGTLPCFRHPDYLSWWLSMAEDQVKSYPIDGLYYSSERVSPLSGVLIGATDGSVKDQNAPGCFCEFCQSQARNLGIDVERAKEGFKQILQFRRTSAETEPGGENPGVVLFRLLLRYPAVAAWETFWMHGYLGLEKQLYGTVKAIAPEVSVGWEISQQGSYSPLYRALDDLSESPRFSDFISHSLRRRAQAGQSLGNVSAETSEKFLADVLGHADASQAGPAADDFVHLIGCEIARVVTATQSSIPVYIAVGNGNVSADIKTALAAGASGVIFPMEFAQDSGGGDLKAAGAAIREMGEMSIA